MSLGMVAAISPPKPSSATRIPIAGLTHQVKLWADETMDREIAIVGPLGCGKSLGLCFKAALLASTNRGIDGMLVVPSYRLARRVHIREWPGIMRKMGLGLQYHRGDACFVWPWGDRLWLGTAEEPESLVGPNLAYVLFDEPGLMVREAYERGAVRARHPEARLRQKVFAGTPEGLNWFSDLFSAPEIETNRRTIWARSWHTSMAHYQAQLLQTYGYDESLTASYVHGKFVPLRVGRAWKFYDPAKHDGAPAYEQEIGLVLACDFNVDAMRWEVMQFVRNDIRVLDEIALGRGGSTDVASREFVRRWQGRHRGQVTVTGDASGRARSTSGKTDYQIIREELTGKFASVDLRIPSANPRVKDRVDNTNYHLAGRGRTISVSRSCRELRRDWERCPWRQGTTELDKTDSERTHAAEAVDYAIWALARASVVRQENYQPAPFDANRDPILGLRG